MKSEKEIRVEVHDIITQTFSVPTEDILDTSLISDLSADSIQLFELLLAFEKFYEIETAYDDVVELHTVKDIVDYVGRVKYGIAHD